MTGYIDDNGQPNPAFNRSRRLARSTTEVIGFLRGIVADDAVSAAEVLGLGEWIDINSEAICEWPVNVLFQRLQRILADGRVDDDERSELKELIDQILGKDNETPFERTSTTLPLCSPAPDVIFDGNIFVLTGRFLYGTRRTCQQEIELRGGRCSNSVTLATSYLVIGQIASRDWAETAYGRKIEAAVRYREYSPVAIISEQHWASFLMDARRGAGA